MSTQTETPKFDLVGEIMAFEGGEMESEERVVALFQYLLDCGLCWTLQGSYGRTARDMIEAGLIA